MNSSKFVFYVLTFATCIVIPILIIFTDSVTKLTGLTTNPTGCHGTDWGQTQGRIDRYLHPGDQSLHPGDQSLHSDNQSLYPGNQSLHPGNQSLHPGPEKESSTLGIPIEVVPGTGIPRGQWKIGNDMMTKEPNNQSVSQWQPVLIQIPTMSRLAPPMFITMKGRLGNNLFELATLLAFCWQSGHRPLLEQSYHVNQLLSIFPAVRDHLCFGPRPQKAVIVRQSYAELYNSLFEQKTHTNEAVVIDGYFQSWKFFRGYEDAIRTLFALDKSYLGKARHMFHNIYKQIVISRQVVPTGNVTFVGVHVRRGDIAEGRGFHNVASLNYLHKALDHFRQRYHDVQFVVCSDTASWSKKYLSGPDIHTSKSPRHLALDLAILIEADHVIMTVGTFGWWGAWLGHGQREVLYYNQPFRNGTQHKKLFHPGDYFPPSWMPLGD